MSRRYLVALAGQPNSGKSTVFNLLTGARQFVANYPGVTVEKKTGLFSHQDVGYELVDLPGTYSLTSYSLEERVARDFLLHDQPQAVINVVDASNLRRNLYLTFQLLEMGTKVVVDLNMIDVAEKRGFEIDLDALASHLGTKVVVTDGKRGKGGEDLCLALRDLVKDKSEPDFRVDYGALEAYISRIQEGIEKASELAAKYKPRWLAIKLLEGDSQALDLVNEYSLSADSLVALVAELRREFEEKEGDPAERYIAYRRHSLASQIVQEVLKSTGSEEKTSTDRVDAVLCHRFLGPVCMVLVFYTLYELAVNQGVKLAAEVTPYLSSLQTFLETFLPAEGFIEIPLLTSLGSWFMTSVNALLVYIPQFFILFALVAVLEDVGYMPRMAFILDRLFRHFGLHGNSTLPMILGGIYVGGCAVPGVMACKAIPDDRSRMATILTVPLMNCLAKTVFYLMLVEAFFPQHKTVAMLFISSITLLFALPIAKILSLTVLKGRETAPFIMEMPPYHLPTIRGVLTRAVERIWVYLKKVVTIVAAVAVVIWALLQFPGFSPEKQAEFQAQADKAFATFQRQVKKDSLQKDLGTMDQVLALLSFRDAYRAAKAGAGGDRQASKAVDQEFKDNSPVFFKVLKDRRSKIYRAFKKLRKTRSRIMREMQQARVNSSLLGQAGKALEPLSRFAGFDWRTNVAMLSSFAARESATATMKVLYGIGPDGKYKGEMGDGEQTITDLNALALMLFMALFPPCLATTIMVKVATGKYKWMLFSFAYPAFLGMVVAAGVYTIGSALNMTGGEAMAWVYALAIGLAVTMGFVKDKKKPEVALGV